MDGWVDVYGLPGWLVASIRYAECVCSLRALVTADFDFYKNQNKQTQFFSQIQARCSVKNLKILHFHVLFGNTIFQPAHRRTRIY